MSKICRCCGSEKPRDAFPKNESSRDGLSSWCRRCHADATARWRAANPEKVAERNQARRLSSLRSDRRQDILDALVHHRLKHRELTRERQELLHRAWALRLSIQECAAALGEPEIGVVAHEMLRLELSASTQPDEGIRSRA